jgi:DNA-binding MarR family transcriptional regulator
MAVLATADPGELPLSAGDVAIAEDIAHHEGTSIRQIAERTGFAQSLVSKTVAAMRDAGILVTRVDPHDRRRVVISVDPSTGTNLFSSRAARAIEPAIRKAKPNLSDADVRAVCELLEELAARLLR